MIETEITILIHRKSDIAIIKKSIINSEIQFPVYIFEYENHFQIIFTSDYEEWELDSKILDCFPEYELTSVFENSKKEIRLQLSRYQSEFSTNAWGNRIENPLNETKYLTRKSKTKPVKFNPKIKVLFKANEQEYYINIVNGINNTSGKKGFLLLNDFKTKNDDKDTNILLEKLYDSPIEAFQYGYYKMQKMVNQDFKEYTENQKKELKELQKVPRKIIRGFINSCNKSEIKNILKNLDEDINFEKRIGWKTILLTNGIQEFEEHIKSPNQELCSRNFKIRSSWNINIPHITIGVKFSSITINNKKANNNIEQYGQISFILKNNKIISIMEVM